MSASSAGVAATAPRLGGATGVDAATVVAAIEGAGITHVVIVPDTHQRTVLELLDNRGAPPVIRAATEDDVFGICAGLHFAGGRPLALIQQLGLFASVNALRAFTHDQHLPLSILAGVYGRNVELPVSHPDQGSAIRYCLPLLDALDLRHTLVEGPGEAHLIQPGLRAAFDEACTSVVLLGAATC